MIGGFMLRIRDDFFLSAGIIEDVLKVIIIMVAEVNLLSPLDVSDRNLRSFAIRHSGGWKFLASRNGGQSPPPPHPHLVY